jgi:hypothetical protein
MKRILIASLVVLAGCATKPPTTTELLLGAWNCELTAGPVTIKGVFNYAPEGKGNFNVNVTGGIGTFQIDAQGEGNATWKLVEEDAKLESKIETVTIASAKVNGNVVAPAMAQTLLGPSLAGQTSTSTIKIDKTSLVLTQPDGSATNCARPAPAA